MARRKPAWRLNAGHLIGGRKESLFPRVPFGVLFAHHLAVAGQGVALVEIERLGLGRRAVGHILARRPDGLKRHRSYRPQQLDEMGAALDAAETLTHLATPAATQGDASSLAKAGVIAGQTAKVDASVDASTRRMTKPSSTVRRSHMSCMASPGLISPR